MVHWQIIWTHLQLFRETLTADQLQPPNQLTFLGNIHAAGPFLQENATVGPVSTLTHKFIYAISLFLLHRGTKHQQLYLREEVHISDVRE